MPSRSPVAALVVLLLCAAMLPARTARGQPDVAGPPAATGRGFIDSAGRRVVLPATIQRVLPAGRDAAVLVEVLAPAKLAAASPRRGRRGMPVEAAPRGTPAAMAATARAVGADLIIDAGPISLERVAFADSVQRLAGIPYILVDDSFDRMPRMLRTIGTLLGVADRARDLGLYADHAISGLRGRLLITPADARPRIYFALGPDGLTTPLPGTPADAALEEAGVINVATALGRDGEARVSIAQIAAWNPTMIIAERPGALARLRREPALRDVAAIRHRQVYLEPTHPFGWIADPSGINRLIGLHWLSTLLYPAATQEDLRTDVCDFYDRFYRVKLTNAQVEAMVRQAGIPPAEAARNVPEPLAGLGAITPSALPPLPSARAGLAPVQRQPAAVSVVSPSALTGVPGLPNTAPGAPCTIPTAPTPTPLPGLAPMPGGAAPRASITNP